MEAVIDVTAGWTETLKVQLLPMSNRVWSGIVAAGNDTESGPAGGWAKIERNEQKWSQFKPYCHKQ